MSKDYVNWYELLKEATEETGDNIDKLQTTLTSDELYKSFDSGFGGTCGKEFTAWGERYVYFPVQYDGAEFGGYAPRNPCDEKTKHWGGG